MQRRKFINTAGAGMAGILAAGTAPAVLMNFLRCIEFPLWLLEDRDSRFPIRGKAYARRGEM